MSRRSVRDVWHAEVLWTPLVRDACRVLLLHLATATDGQGRHVMTELGRIKVPRERLAADLGINPKRVTDRITEATRVGLLVKVGGGHNGQVAEYAARPQASRKVPAEPVPTRGPASLAGLVKVPANGGPSRAAEPVPTPVANDRRRVTKVLAEPAPYVRARARAPYRNRGTEPAPDGSRGPEPHHTPNSSSNEDGATPAPVVAASPWVPTTQPQPAGRWSA